MPDQFEEIYSSHHSYSGGEGDERIVRADSVPSMTDQVSDYISKLGFSDVTNLLAATTAMDAESLRRKLTRKLLTTGMRKLAPHFFPPFMSQYLSQRDVLPSSIVQGYLASQQARRRRDLGAYPGAAYQPGPAGPAKPGYGKGYESTPRNQIEQMIRQEAEARGMDPNYAIRVYRGEGAGGYFGDYTRGRPTSFGPFQLHRGGPGSVGTEFERQTGLNLEDQSTIPQQIQFALNWANRHGWAAWHGRPGGRGGPTGIGVTGRQVPLTPHAPGWRGAGGTFGGGGATAEIPAGAAAPHVIERQAQVAAVRRGAISPQLRGQLEYAGQQTGLTAEVTSGGQRMPSAPGAKGSHRHDVGGAADLKLRDTATGRHLDMRNPRDAARMGAFVSHAVRAGATGVGAGLRYMGPHTIHIGGGKPATWGGASWVREAWAKGRSGGEIPTTKKSTLPSTANQPQPVYPEGKPPE